MPPSNTFDHSTNKRHSMNLIARYTSSNSVQAKSKSLAMCIQKWSVTGNDMKQDLFLSSYMLVWVAVWEWGNEMLINESHSHVSLLCIDIIVFFITHSRMTHEVTSFVDRCWIWYVPVSFNLVYDAERFTNDVFLVEVTHSQISSRLQVMDVEIATPEQSLNASTSLCPAIG